MAINFPDTPVIDDVFVVGSKSWKYDGEKWNTASASPLPSVLEVSISDPQDGEALVYNDITDQWENSAVAAVGEVVSSTPHPFAFI
jgi:hypothetical protein